MLWKRAGIALRRCLSSTSTNDIRRSFLDFFQGRGHTILPSSSLVPHRDATLMFTNAGMVQFKDYFLGTREPEHVQVATAQRCVRAGGKHNDLDNVGRTPRHHTYFEMLGNFSFGGYFKEGSIALAWEYLTKHLQLPKDRLSVTVHERDEESFDIWKAMDQSIPVRKLGDEENFWQMGPTGPCGPCSEIFWDLGHGSEEDRFLEIWNLVFMQFNQTADGQLLPLRTPMVDTGMGLERIASVLQNRSSNFETDVMGQLVDAVQVLVHRPLVTFVEQEAVCIVADHVRAVAFLAGDGVRPEAGGRGYVMRRIVRRAAAAGRQLGLRDPFLASLVPVVAKLGPPGNTLCSLEVQTQVQAVLEREEAAFSKTLERGLNTLEQVLPQSTHLDASVAFELHDTHGFPLELTVRLAEQAGVTVDVQGFHQCMEEQRKRARLDRTTQSTNTALDALATWAATAPPLSSSTRVYDAVNRAYDAVNRVYDAVNRPSVTCSVVACEQMEEQTWVVLDPCPFYAQGGGQACDGGSVVSGGVSLTVMDVQRLSPDHVAVCLGHEEEETVSLPVGESVVATIDVRRRRGLEEHHTATHLLHAALQHHLGATATQAGSLVAPDRLRFDVTWSERIPSATLRAVETWVNTAANAALPIHTEWTDTATALASGAMGLFADRLDPRQQARVVRVPGWSAELCGGTHVKNTALVRPFVIVSESSAAAGVRRIEAVTGSAAWPHLEERSTVLENVALVMGVDWKQVPVRVERWMERQRQLTREVARLQQQPLDTMLHAGRWQDQRLVLHPLPVTGSEDGKRLGRFLSKQREMFPDDVHVAWCGPHVGCGTSSNVDAHAVLKSLFSVVRGRGGGNALHAQGRLQEDPHEVETKIHLWAAQDHTTIE